MSSTITKFSCGACSIELCALLLVSSAAALAADLNAEMVKQIEAALPENAPAQVRAPHKMLVFTQCKGFVHSSIPYGAFALEKMGLATGAYTATVTDDIAAFSVDNLKQYDAVCMLNTTGEVFPDDATKAGLLDFVRNGKGLVGIHAATDCSYQWSQYGEMMGGYFDGHPWGSGDTVTLRLDDPGHPLNAAFAALNFVIKDEIYQFKEPYSRDALRVLTTLDVTKTDMTKKTIRRTDGDFPISWVRAYGKGRVFYCSLGHNESTYWNATVMKHYLSGIQFALGDLAADTTPSAQRTEKQKAESESVFLDRSVESLFAELATYDYGKPSATIEQLMEAVIASHAQPQIEQRMAAHLAAVLAANSTLAAKEWACKQLCRIGGENDVSAIAPLLKSPETADVARYALERIPGGKAERALLDALHSPDSKIVVGSLNSLAARRSERAVSAMRKLIGHGDASVAEAAIVALGKIGNQDAGDALSSIMRHSATPALRPALADAYLLCADKQCAEGRAKDALSMYQFVFEQAYSTASRNAAFLGMVRSEGEAGALRVVAAFGDPDEALRATATVAAQELCGDGVTAQLVSAASTLPASAQVLLLNVFVVRGDASALPWVIEATSSSELDVRCAALQAVGKMGNASSVPVLTKASSAVEQRERNAATVGLVHLRGEGVDEAILAAIESSEPAIRAMLIRSLPGRNAKSTVPMLIKYTQDNDESVRVESFNALATLAASSHLPSVIQSMLSSTSDTTRQAGEDAVVAIASKLTEKQAQTTIDAIEHHRSDETKYLSLLRIAGRLGADDALPILRSALKGRNNSAREIAVRSVANWPTDAVLDDLQRLLKKKRPSTNQALRSTALRGYVRLLGYPSGRSTEESLVLYEKALKKAVDNQDIKLILAGLANVRHPRVLKVIEPYLNDPDTKEEARLVVEKLGPITYAVTSSDNDAEALQAVDGKLETRWTTGTAQKSGQWFMLDLGWEREVSRVVFDAGTSAGDYPRAYRVYVSSSEKSWGPPVAEGKGDKPLIEISVKPKLGRFVKVVQSGSDPGLWWSIHEAKVECK